MKNNSLYLPGFHLSTLRRKPRSTAHKLADSLAYIRRHSISSLGECFGRFIPSKVLAALVVTMVLISLNKFPLFSDTLIAVKRLIVITMPASMGAIIVDSFDKE